MHYYYCRLYWLSLNDERATPSVPPHAVNMPQLQLTLFLQYLITKYFTIYHGFDLC